MTDFSTPPAGTAVNEDTSKQIGRDHFISDVPETSIAEAEKTITAELRAGYLSHIMMDTPFQQTFKLAEGKLVVTLQTKTVGVYDQGFAFLDSVVDQAKLAGHFNQLVNEIDLAGYLSKISYNDGHSPKVLDFSSMSLEQRMEGVKKFSTSKMALLLQVMLKFIASLEALRRDVVKEGF